jgi:hypothetical protein
LSAVVVQAALAEHLPLLAAAAAAARLLSRLWQSL